MSTKRELRIDARVRAELESLTDADGLVEISIRRLGLRLGLDEIGTGFSVRRLIKSGAVIIARRNNPQKQRRKTYRVIGHDEMLARQASNVIHLFLALKSQKRLARLGRTTVHGSLELCGIKIISRVRKMNRRRVRKVNYIGTISRVRKVNCLLHCGCVASVGLAGVALAQESRRETRVAIEIRPAVAVAAARQCKSRLGEPCRTRA
jgi:hypothetical protein